MDKMGGDEAARATKARRTEIYKREQELKAAVAQRMFDNEEKRVYVATEKARLAEEAHLRDLLKRRAEFEERGHIHKKFSAKEALFSVKQRFKSELERLEKWMRPHIIKLRLINFFGYTPYSNNAPECVKREMLENMKKLNANIVQEFDRISGIGSIASRLADPAPSTEHSEVDKTDKTGDEGTGDIDGSASAHGNGPGENRIDKRKYPDPDPTEPRP